jgi:hypothetical protein
MMEASISETSVNWYEIHSAISQNTVTFTLAAGI